MNGTVAAVSEYASSLAPRMAAMPAGLAFVFCPPVLYFMQAKGLTLGGQNCHAEMKGAFTGELSAAMLKEAGAQYVILGHSERRAIGETDAIVVAKARAAIAVGLTPVICIGEQWSDYQAGNTEQALRGQLASLEILAAGNYLIAYEPVWAIGAGKTPSAEAIAAAHAVVKSALGSATPVLYGGSVNATNVHEILAIPGVSGALVGSASLDASATHTMIDAAISGVER